MLKNIILAAISFIHLVQGHAQYRIEGRITGSGNQPLEGASISVKNSYYGATSSKDGSFFFDYPDKGSVTVVFSFSGYKSLEQEIVINIQVTILDAKLKEDITEMKAVIISAGLFEASDKKRATVLKSLDIVTTAGQQADITAALKTLPGAQQIGEQEGLFIHGGTGNETKVYIDGMMISNAFFSSVPGIAQRSRFSPLLFKGTVFSSGGYSAQYGQGLSSVLLLESVDLPSRSEVNMIISSVQQSLLTQKLNKAKTGSAGFNINYTNMSPYFAVIPQKYRYNKAPEIINGEFNLRQKIKDGMFKIYTYASHHTLGFKRPDLDYPGLDEYFYLRNTNFFSNATYTARFQNSWQLFYGTSFSYNKDKISMYTPAADSMLFSFYPHLTNRTLQMRAVVTKNFPGLTRLYIGGEQQCISDIIEAKDSISRRKVNDHHTAAFIESDIYYSVKLVSKAGIRYEYSSLLKRMNLVPRLSLAYKLSSINQLSLAYGIFYQKPETNYLFRNSSLRFTMATHYILNFQHINKGRILRTEAFYKKYHDLITTADDTNEISNKGTGYAKGVELFWRDKTSVKNLDYWVSYSLLDSKRKFLDYPSSVQPPFAARHTLNVVAKCFSAPLSTQFSALYSFASGRPYYNPAKPVKDFMADRTMSYHSVGLQLNYLRTWGNMNAVFILNMSNVFAWDQVFSYRYASRPNAPGQYAKEAITPMAKRFIFIGMYLSIGSDRRKEILD